MRVLYVEDDPLDADLTRRALQKNAPHFGLDIARSYREALQLLDSKSDFDIMLTDLNLPDGSGFALLSHVREHRIPIAVVVITGQGDEEIAVSVLKAGADDYLVKRQDYLDRLPLTLTNAFQRHKAEIARRERPLHVLYLENDLTDVDLTKRHFSNHAPHIHLEVVHTASDVFAKFPEQGNPADVDALMLDYRQYDLNALDLLKELRDVRGLDLPIVLVTGHGNEEVAAQALRLGASDYVVKSPGYLFRLPGLLENAYHRAQLLREQEALRNSEERFRRLAENAPDAIYRFRVSPHLALEYVSPAIVTISGYTPSELHADPDLFFKMIHPEDALLARDVFEGKYPVGKPVVLRFVNREEKLVWVEARNAPVYDRMGSIVFTEGIARDVTERKMAEENIQRQLQRLNALRVVDSAISSHLSLNVTLNILLGHVISQLGAHAADILLFDTTTQMLNYGAGTGFRLPAIDSLSLHLGEGCAGEAALHRRTVFIPDRAALDREGGFPELLAGEGFVAYYGTPLVAKGQVKGVLEVYHRFPFSPDSEWMNFFETLAGQAAIAIDNAEMFEGLQRANQELMLAYDRTLEGWVRALDLRDRETQGHTQRVTDLTMHLARAMGTDEISMVQLRRGALLHDIGKIGIPDAILHKPGPLNDEEWLLMRKHPEYARDLLSPIDYLHQALLIPYCHHEWWDGSGYPQGLKGEQIPLSARIFAVVDVWDALRSDRPYRRAWDKERVLEYIKSLSGTHFDPDVVESFMRLVQGDGVY